MTLNWMEGGSSWWRREAGEEEAGIGQGAEVGQGEGDPGEEGADLDLEASPGVDPEVAQMIGKKNQEDLEVAQMREKKSPEVDQMKGKKSLEVDQMRG